MTVDVGSVYCAVLAKKKKGINSGVSVALKSVENSEGKNLNLPNTFH